MKNLHIIIIIILFIFICNCVCREKLIQIPGFNSIKCNAEKTITCRYVPYAQYPFRFEPAKPLRPWSNNSYDYYLTMDIFTKHLNKEKPVIVGLLQENLGEFDQHVSIPRIMLKKCVFVSIRYRAGLYGFLSTNTPQIRGNEALFDIQIALQWIQNYIFYFGGNLQKVTLMGLEDSGSLVHALAISPKIPNGLFNNIIIGETTSFTPRLTTNEPLKFAFQIALEAGCRPLDTVNDLNECLLNPNNNLVQITRKCLYKERKRTNFSPIKMTIGDYGNLLPEHPLLIAQNSRKHYPMLMGTSNNILKSDFEEFINEDDFLNFIPHIERIMDDAMILIKRYSDPESEEKWIDMIQYQVTNMTGHFSNRSIYMNVLKDLIGILNSKYPILEAAKYNTPTYLYAFNYNLFTLNTNQLGFMDFDSSSSSSGGLEDKAFRNLMKIWITFAETNEPPPSIPNLYDEWPTVGDFTYPYLKLNKFSYIHDNFEDEFQQFKNKYLDSLDEEDLDEDAE